MRKWLIILILILSGCATAQYKTITVNGDSVTLKAKPWWNCSEVAYYSYKQLSKKYPSKIIIGRYYYTDAPERDYVHAWVEYQKGGKTFIFDDIPEYHLIRIPSVSGETAYKLIEREQYLRSWGLNAEVFVRQQCRDVAVVAIITDSGIEFEDIEDVYKYNK